MNDTALKIQLIERKIESKKYLKEVKNIREWGGADVIIRSEMTRDLARWLDAQPTVVSFQSTDPMRRLILTRYSKELSWFFYQLADLFKEIYDYVSKYDLYACFAESAKEHLDRNKDTGPEGLLLYVLNDGTNRFLYLMSDS